MRVLVACEESQVVCIAFRERGHEAYSCDIQECSGGHPEWHIQDDVLLHLEDGWDMMIAFPPCTHIAVSGAAWFEEKRKDGRQQEGIDFFMAIVNAPIGKIAIENPVGIMSKIYRPPDQKLHPYHFGDPYSKTTCFWLKNLSKLSAKYIDAPLFGESVDKGEFVVYESGRCMPKWYAELRGDGKNRSKTFPGIAKAMAEQWG